MIIHKELAQGRWFELSLVEQLANIGSEISRTIKWKNVGNLEFSQRAFERALDLLYLTVEDPKNRGRQNRGRLREILRTREALIDHFICDNFYCTTDEQWQKYFYQFNYSASLLAGR
jgi:hypothetical protein